MYVEATVTTPVQCASPSLPLVSSKLKTGLLSGEVEPTFPAAVWLFIDACLMSRDYYALKSKMC